MAKHESLNWQPNCTQAVLVKRAALLKVIRDFFYQRDVLEVETPLLASHGVSDIYLDNFKSDYFKQTFYLQTSPEYHMKRLLSSGSGSVYQITKAFRHEACGKLHNPEFSMLEWYRVGFTLPQLMAEVAALLTQILSCPEPHFISYQALVLKHLKICPMTATIDELRQCVSDNHINFQGELDSKTQYLSLLMTHLIEPEIGEDVPCFVFDFPKEQASLAKINKGCAKRFEVYYKGVELANGFDELLCAREQSKRFEQDNIERESLGLEAKEADGYLLKALEAGLPQCAGVALGLDRLFMLALGRKTIAEVMSFTFDRA